MATGLVFVSPASSEPTFQTTASPAAAAVAPAPVAAHAAPPSFAPIVRRVSPAVVSLTTNKALGSGFLIESSGYIVTNNHVIAGATEITANLEDGRKFKARLIGRDEATDIALLKIDAPVSLPSVRFGDDRSLQVGDWVVAVGNPLGLGGTVTAGILSARGRDQVGSGQFTDYLQVDAAINMGNSGGPTFDTSGRVVGMNTIAINSQFGSGIGFAIPSSTIQRVVADLKSMGSVARGFLGVQIESLSDDAAQALGLPNSNGALVTGVIEGSPAEKSGIKRGDVVLKINGQAVKDNRDLSRRIAALQVGDSATFTIWRDNKQMNVTVTVTKRDAVADAGPLPATGGQPETRLTSLGLALQTITDSVRGEFSFSQEVSGVLITGVDVASNAAVRGLRAGDRIVAVGSTDVKSLTDVNLAVEEAKSLKRPAVLLFVVTAAGSKTHVTVQLPGN